MKYILKWVFINMLLIFPMFVFAETGVRVYEHLGKFSYCPPLNWNVTDFPGLKYKAIIGPIDGSFAANIVFVDETFDGNLNTYVNYNLIQMENFFQRYRLLSRDAFRTNSGIIGERVIYNSFQHGFFLRAVAYFLQISNNKYIVITCGSLDNVGTRYLSLFDESIKTLELIN